MTTLIADPEVEERLIAERQAKGWDRKDEVWDGTYIVMPDPNIELQLLVGRLMVALSAVVNAPAGGDVFPGLNLSDRSADWKVNYRCPDAAVILAGNTAQVFESHICGPADFLVEIVSPGDKSRDKLDFYGDLGVRELLLIDRYPWSLDVYRHNGRKLVLAGQSGLARNDSIVSTVLPVSFQLIPAQPRPQILVTDIAGARSWTV